MRPLLILLSLLLFAGAAPAAVHVVVPGGSLQAAVDAAAPGDTVLVRPGVYGAARGARSVVHVRTDGLTLIGSLGAVIDASGVDYGVLVGEDRHPRLQGCPPSATVEGFTLRGFTVQRAGHTGVRLVGVEQFRVSHGVHLQNAVHAVASACSRDGRVDHNLATEHSGAAFASSNVVGLRADHNIAKHNGMGLEFENTVDGVATENWLTDNGAGVVVVARPGHPVPIAENLSIEFNWIAENDRAAMLGDIPSGTGILNIGGDDVRIRKNTVIGHRTLGIGSFASPYGALDPRLEPFVDGLVVSRNIVKRNGRAPDADALPVPPADLVFVPDVLDPASGESVAIDPDATDCCFVGNHFDSELPAGIADRLRCD